MQEQNEMDLLGIYKKILRIRLIEQKLDYFFKRGFVHGTAHFCVGQEFIPVIISQYLTQEDGVTSTHRGHAHALSKGIDEKSFIVELLGRKTGCNSGKSGSQHILSKEKNFFMNGITGGMIPIANGLAFANKYKGKKEIIVAYLGDGGFNEGYVMESFNLASVLHLPILFVCENNLYAMSTNVKTSHSAEIIDKIKSFGIKSESIQDNDFKKLDAVAKQFISEIREKSEPRFIEVKTYRHYGHSKNDLNLYRDKAEEKAWMEKDALKIIEKQLISSNKSTQEEINAINFSFEREIDVLANEITSIPEDDASNILKNIYAE